jgi:peptidoglycan/xylan/chitin deacetylase (PgdA/CDA1 family)
VVVTFDDGYVDNLLTAKPLLAQYDVPATVFLVTEALVEDRNFWWDDLEGALLQPGTLPEHLEFEVNHSQYEWDLGDACVYRIEDRQKDRQRRPWDAPKGTRLAFFYIIWQHLLKLSKPERIEALDAICTWAGMSKDLRRAGRALSKHEVNALREGSLIEVGAHTVTHPSLTVLSKSQQMEEIANSKTQLENIMGHPVTNFSYPHGDYSVETIDLVHKAGFQSASTTKFKCVFPDADPFQLPRFQVDDWSGEEFLRRLARWYLRP